MRISWTGDEGQLRLLSGSILKIGNARAWVCRERANLGRREVRKEMHSEGRGVAVERKLWLPLLNKGH